MAEIVCKLDNAQLPVRTRSAFIDWEVLQGEAWLLDGGVGAGKTTLIKTLTGLINPLSGRVTLFGNELRRLSQRRLLRLRERIAVLFEHDGLIASWTVRENLILPHRYRGTLGDVDIFEQRAVQELLEIGETKALMEERVSHLTGRQRRRIALLRVLLAQPELVLIDDLPLYLNPDEPDTESLLERLCDGRRTVIACAPASWRRYFRNSRPSIAQLGVRGLEFFIDHIDRSMLARESRQ